MDKETMEAKILNLEALLEELIVLLVTKGVMNSKDWRELAERVKASIKK